MTVLNGYYFAAAVLGLGYGIVQRYARRTSEASVRYWHRQYQLEHMVTRSQAARLDPRPVFAKPRLYIEPTADQVEAAIVELVAWDAAVAGLPFRTWDYGMPTMDTVDDPDSYLPKLAPPVPVSETLLRALQRIVISTDEVKAVVG